MFKLLILLVHLLGVTVNGTAGYKYNQPRHTSKELANRSSAHTSSAAAISHTANGPPTIYEKSFYYFSAPEEKHEPIKQLAINAVPTSHQNNLQIIFIETPQQQSYKSSIHKVAKNAAQQQTHSYVLNKQPEVKAVSSQYQVVHSSVIRQQQQHQPEVHFIKYRTESGTERAQQHMRAQYGALGTSSTSHGGVRPSGLILSPMNSAANLQNRAPTSLAVDKNYASNFLPTGIDVVPGSSYIPLALRT